MKIAMIGQKQVPSRKGGIEVAVEELAIRIAKEGHDVTLYNYRRRRDEDETLNSYVLKKKQREYQGVHIKEIKVFDIKFAAVVSSFCNTIYALFQKYDVIHYHAEGPALMCMLTHFFRRRTIVTIHGLDWKRSKWGKIASWYLKLGEKMAVAYADEIIVLSVSAKQYFENTYQRKTVLIHNGINKPVIKEANLITHKWGVKKEDYILYLGRIVPEKGLEDLVRGFTKIDTNKKLVIAGHTSDTKKFAEKLRRIENVDKRIIFTGFVQGEELTELYSNAYFYCLPSQLEGMPISLLEAMSYGNCCLCSDIPECMEVLGGYGQIFKSGNIDSLCQKIQVLCDNPNLVYQYKDTISEYVCTSYNWNEIAKETIEVYKDSSMTIQ